MFVVCMQGVCLCVCVCEIMFGLWYVLNMTYKDLMYV